MNKSFLDGLSKGLDTFLSIKLGQSLSHVEGQVARRAYRFKRKVFTSVLELFFLLLGAALFIVGLILVIANYIALEYILLVGGIVMLYLVLLLGKFR